MKTILRFKADDGKVFDTEKDCIEYEKLIVQVEKTMSMLPKKPDGCRFANGEGYIQHKASDVIQAKNQIVDLANKHFKTNYGFGFIGRVSYHTLKLCGFLIHREPLASQVKLDCTDAAFSTGLESLRTIGTKNLCKYTK